MRVIIIGSSDEFDDLGDKDGSPLADNAINRASLRLEEIKFGDLAGVQNAAEDTTPEDLAGDVLADMPPGIITFTATDVAEAAKRYGWNNAVAWSRMGVPPVMGVASSWLDGFLHGAAAVAGLTPHGEEMKGRLP